MKTNQLFKLKNNILYRIDFNMTNNNYTESLYALGADIEIYNNILKLNKCYNYTQPNKHKLNLIIDDKNCYWNYNNNLSFPNKQIYNLLIDPKYYYLGINIKFVKEELASIPVYILTKPRIIKPIQYNIIEDGDIKYFNDYNNKFGKEYEEYKIKFAEDEIKYKKLFDHYNNELNNIKNRVKKEKEESIQYNINKCTELNNIKVDDTVIPKKKDTNIFKRFMNWLLEL